MDCYGMLTTTEQLHRRKEGKIGDKEILMHVVIKEVTKLLMDPNLDCSDPEYKRIFSLDYVGYRLENAGLVHIPCPIGEEWILIVANFIDKSFDVLNPDSGVGKFSEVVNTVIFNFKQLFVKCYPGCFKFNIHDFSVKYVHVPKQNFRYDSGIFVIQYMRCYNGVEVKQFSNVDLQAIREKVSCQLVINKFNEQQVPIAREFISKHSMLKQGDSEKLQPDMGHIVLACMAGMAEREKQYYGRALFINIAGNVRVTPEDLVASLEQHCELRPRSATAEVTSPPYHFFI
ncbi:uncharacterized protein LOC124696551 [Lolium rigidum]|uniref:uncharacterized protein LOC124696551 n=1 Tax=Lolium rigidum TaxID=89674 RepID=UPI001F5CE530|nr:uncharacterized protein LOC124696551 [Lolium rigidum]